MADENVQKVCELINKIHLLFPEKKIWLYTGFTAHIDKYNYINVQGEQVSSYRFIAKPTTKAKYNIYRSSVMSIVDVLVDGPFIDELKDLSLQFRGSSNQRLIDVQESIKQGQVIVWQSK